MTWLASLPAVDHLPFAVDATYREWLRHDREGALRWLREAEPNPTFEPAISLYALVTVSDDLQTALEWAQRLQDEELRHQTLEKLARAWLANDPEAARAWIEGSELPEAARQRVLAPPKKPQRTRPGKPQRTRPGKPQQRDDAAANRINGPG
jgi:ABC-type microcin C transport system duplicated ATPase subunit YejF